jgi:methylornithine synthase
MVESGEESDGARGRAEVGGHRGVSHVGVSETVENICSGALAGLAPSPAEVLQLLRLRGPGEAEPLFTAARELRRRHFSNTVFLYGFVYYSTYCRNSCSFCFYRAENTLSPRYRKGCDEVVEICRALADSGVNLLDLTLGEDPLLFGVVDFSPLVEVVASVRRATGLPIMVSPGVVPQPILAALHSAGADFYALYQETHTPELFARLRLGQDFERRVQARRDAHVAGLLVEDGLLSGVGDKPTDRAISVLAMRKAGDQQVRVMTLVPQKQTPLAKAAAPGIWNEVLTIAIMRLLMPDRLIPASLDVEGIEGLRSRLDAGANVVTSLIPPQMGLCGVAHAEYEVDDGLRTAAEVRARLPELGLRQGAQAEFETWLRAARTKASINHVEQASEGLPSAVDAFRTVFFREPGSGQRALSFAEVQAELLPAWNLSEADRYYYDPKKGVFFGGGLDLPQTYPWSVTNLEAVPTEGWTHDDGCGCVSCRCRPREKDAEEDCAVTSGPAKRC